MKHLRFASFCAIALLASAIITPFSSAAPGDAVIIRIFVASHWSAKNYHVEPAGSDNIIPPIEISEQGEAFALYSFALVEGEAYDFVFLPEDDVGTPEGPLQAEIRFIATASTPEYICEAAAKTLQARPGPSPTPSPSPATTARPTPTAGPSEEIDVDTSDANALVLADTGAPAPEGNPGDTVVVTLPLAVNRDYLASEFYSLRNITIEPDIPVRRRGEGPHISDWPFDIEQVSYLRKINEMSNNARADVSYEFRISQNAEADVYVLLFRVSATVLRYNSFSGAMITEDVVFILRQYVNVLSSGSDDSEPAGALTLSASWDGDTLPAPRGKGGDRISISLPIVSNGDLTDVTIEPVFSADADECPIVFEAVNYTKALPNLARGESTLIDFNFKLLPDESGGNKPLTFKAKYRNGGIAGECLLTTFLYVEPEDTGEETDPLAEAPFVTLEGYALAVDGQAVDSLYVGDSARLSLQFRNNASVSTARRLLITVSPGDMLLLETGASNTQYIDSLDADESASVFFDLSARDNAMQGPASIDITLDYEGEDGEPASLSQSISIALLQRARVETEPAIVNGGNAVIAGEHFPVRAKLLNLGMAEIRNIRALVEGAGLTTFESYFGRTLLPSESANIELRVLCDAGEHSGHIIITYESGDGETHELSEPIRVTAETAPAPTPDTTPAQTKAEDTNSALQTAVIAVASALAVALGALAYIFFTRLRKKQEKRNSSYPRSKNHH